MIMSSLHSIELEGLFDNSISSTGNVTRTNILTGERAYVLHNLFSPVECERIIEAAEKKDLISFMVMIQVIETI